MVTVPFVIQQRDTVDISFSRAICHIGICCEIAKNKSVYIEANKDFRFGSWLSVLIDILWRLNLKARAY